MARGGYGIRTRVDGFAGRYLSSRSTHHNTHQLTQHATMSSKCEGADDGIRTRDPHLGKVMLYQLSYIRIRRHATAITR